MKDQISALMDEELDPAASQHLFVALKKDEKLLECWSTYHLIGDQMRGTGELSEDFYGRLMQRLDDEPVVLAPKRKISIKQHPLMSVAASVAAVMVVGWMLMQKQTPFMANDPAVATVAQNTVTPESVNAYLVAHRQLSPDSVSQASYYLRPVNFSGNGN